MASQECSSYTLLDDAAVAHVSKHGKASLFSIWANLVMSGLGAGILSLPWATAGASIIPSVLTIILVMALNAITIMILVYAAERHGTYDLGTLLAHLPGRVGSFVQIFNNALTWFSVFLTLVGYIVVMADSLEPFAASFMAHRSMMTDYFWSVRAPILAVSGIIVLPICFVDQQKLAISSVVGICVTIYLFFVVVRMYASEGVAEDCCMISGVHEGTITMFSTLMQCTIVQMCILPMYEELEDRSPRRFGLAVGGAFGFLAVLFASFSAVAYSVFGPTVQGNVMNNLPHDFYGDTARLGMAVVMLAVFPIMMLSMVAPVKHWDETTGHTNGFLAIVLSVLIVAACSVAAAFVGQLGALNAMNGALQVSCFIGLAPGLCGLYLLGQDGFVWKSAMYLLLATSLLSSLVGSFYTDNAVSEVYQSCFWSISSGQ